MTTNEKETAYKKLQAEALKEDLTELISKYENPKEYISGLDSIVGYLEICLQIVERMIKEGHRYE